MSLEKLFEQEFKMKISPGEISEIMYKIGSYWDDTISRESAKKYFENYGLNLSDSDFRKIVASTIPRFAATMIFCLTITFLGAFGIDSIPSQNRLFSSIDSFQNQKAKAEVLQFKNENKTTWIDYIPSLGIGFGVGTKEVNGQPVLASRLQPSINYSLSEFRQTRRDKKQNENIVLQILELAEIAKSEEKRMVAGLLMKLETLNEDLLFDLKVHEIDSQLWDYYKTSNQKGDIQPIIFLQRQKDWMTKEQAIRIKKREIRFLEIEILETSHFDNF